MNQFATPGLGSLLARRYVAGTGQLLIFLAGFVMFVAWFADEMQQYYALMFTDSQPHVRNWLVIWGLPLCAVGWLWALVTSISLMREAKRNAQAAMQSGAHDPSATPPLL